MTKYEFLRRLADKCQDCRNNASDENLRKFFDNALKGFEKRIRRMSIEEAECRGLNSCKKNSAY